MSRSVQIPLVRGEAPQIRFPRRCVCCSAPAQAESTLAVSRLTMRGQRQQEIRVRYAVPHCARCHRATTMIFLAGLLPFLVGAILLGGAAFGLGAFYADAIGLDRNSAPGSANALLVGAAVGLTFGLVGGALFEGLARLLLLPFFGRALWQAPLLAQQLLRDSDYVAGLEGALRADGSLLQLTFANDELGQEFEQLNSSDQA